MRGSASYQASPYPPFRGMVAVLIGINVAVYIALTVDRTAVNADLGRLDYWLAMIPFKVWSEGQIWRLFTYMFLHGPLFHILFNMFVLWMFGSECENVMGRRRFLFYYLFTGVGAALCQLGLAALMPAALAGTVMIGASGAVYGLLLAYALYFPNRWLLLFFVLPVRAKYLVLGFAALEFLLAMTNFQDGIAHMAHLGGLLFGFLLLKHRTLKSDLRYWYLRAKGAYYRRKFRVLQGGRDEPPKRRFDIH